jgi:Predicted HD superfamily hydrolase
VKKEIDPLLAANKNINTERSFQRSFVLAEAKKVFVQDSSWTQHGPSHWLQVEKNAVMLGEHTPGCDLEVARLFALLHDCKRQNEGRDPDHGARAADFAQELFDKGMLHLNHGRLSTLKFAMIHHNGGQVSDDPTIGVCWDADRLDLPRVGTTPDSELLSTQYARDLLKAKR